MSLYVDEDRPRARSRSRDRRSRDEPPRENPTFTDIREPSYVYPEDDLDDRYRSRRGEPAASRSSKLPYPAEGGIDHMLPGDQPLYGYDTRQPTHRTNSPPREQPYRSSRDRVDEQPPGSFPGDDDFVPYEPKRDRREKKSRDKEDRDSRHSRYPDPRLEERGLDEDKLSYLPQKYSRPSEKDGRHLDREDRYRDEGRYREEESKYRDEDRRREKDDRNREKYDPRDSDEERRRHHSSKYSSRYDDVEDTYRSKSDGRNRRDRLEDGRDALEYPPEKNSSKRYPPDDMSKGSDRGRDGDDKLKYLPQKYSSKYNDDDERRFSDRERDKEDRRRRRKEETDRDDDLAYGRPLEPLEPIDPTRPPNLETHETYGSYLSGSTWEDRHHLAQGAQRRATSPGPMEPVTKPSRRDQYPDDPRSSQPHVLTVDPDSRERDRSRDRRRDKSPMPEMLTVEPKGGRDRSRSRDRSRTRGERRKSHRDKSPQPPIASMSSLTVDSGRPAGNLTVAAAPASPLLESYQGTYQTCSPMPSPLLLTSGSPTDDARALEALSPITSDTEADGKKRTRRARFHDPQDIASRLAVALRGEGPPDKEPLVEILPSLTHEQVMELREDYKSIVKTGSRRKGVNIAKHIRARLKDENPNLMKACYAVALGRWESEAYWANYWYQGDKTRRELLIESLMGRTNSEIRRIKDAFTDKRYDNDLIKCMKTELKEDKFKKAVLLVLEERRMEDTDLYGKPLPIDYKLVDQDVDDLYKAVKSEKGGESLMMSIVVQRSDIHLREVLKEYERSFRSNFARESLRKSGNLVGELLAHILNGVINRPVRDALLLHHALTVSRKDELRHELLTSRLVRAHWDASHMQAVRRAYQTHYDADLQQAVHDATGGTWGMFCEELCIARVPNDVRRMKIVN